MKLKRLPLYLLVLAAAFAALQAAGLVEALSDASGGLQIEPGRRRAATLSPELREELPRFDEEVRLTYFVSRAESLPPHLRHLEDGVRDVLRAFERAATEAGRPLTTAVVHPEDHPEWETSLASSGLAPWRARRVEGDGYRDDELWSSLRLGYGARPSAVLNGIGPEQVAWLQPLVLEQLRELEAPRRPRVALSAPEGYAGLRALLATGAEVQDVDFDADATLPAGVDLFVWVEPRVAGEAQLATLDALRASGGNAILAGEAFTTRERFEGEELRATIAPRPSATEVLWPHLGLEPIGGLLFDARAGEVEGAPRADGTRPAQLAPWLARCTPNQQDFRTLLGQPNAGLLFRTPSAFVPDPTRLDELGVRATVIASASELATRVPLPAEELTAQEGFDLVGRSQPNVALGALLAPIDPWSGRTVVLASATPMADEYWDHPNYGHPQLATILLTTLLSGERMVASRIALRAPDVLPPLAPAQRAWLRLLAVFAVPALLAIVWAGRGRARGGRNAPSGAGALVLGGGAIAALVVGGLTSLSSGAADADWTRDGRNRLTESEATAFAGLLDGPVEFELVFSSPDRLPPEFRPRVRELRRECARLAARFDDITVRQTAPEADADALRDAGIEPLAISSTQSEGVRLFRPFAAVRVRAGAQERVLEFPTERSFARLHFRLAHALASLRAEGPTRLALVSQPPRLSPAEAALEYQRKGLFAPREGDPYGALEDLLAEHGFEVLRVDPNEEALPTDVDATFWLQPRREVRATLAQLTQELAKGGRALIAGQHFRIRSRQLEGAALQQRYWPEPQYLDLERLYLPDLGLLLPRELVLDERSGTALLETRVDGANGATRYERLSTTKPFLVRTAAGPLPALGELLLPFATRLELDREVLAANELEVEEWVRGEGGFFGYRWQGGDLASDVLVPSRDTEVEGLTYHAQPALYAALLRGRFPRAEMVVPEGGSGEALFEVQPSRAEQPVGELLVIGDADLLSSAHLNRSDSDHEGFALRAASRLSFGQALDPFLGRRRSEPALAPLEDSERLAWRLVVLGGFPLALLLYGALRRRLA